MLTIDSAIEVIRHAGAPRELNGLADARARRLEKVVAGFGENSLTCCAGLILVMQRIARVTLQTLIHTGQAEEGHRAEGPSGTDGSQ